ncbi:MAG: sulfatase [Planctomycetota bacterium]|nr:sulfatase [Planctomycetota bacterium]
MAFPMMMRPAAAGLALGSLLLASCGAGVEQRGDVLLIVIDTLRADALSCYGNEGPTSPVLDALAADGLRFDEVLTQAPNTATSHATLFTGLYPWTHRVANLTSLEHGTAGLPPAFITLAERFAAAGYDTAAFTDGGPLGRAWNLMQGFDHLAGQFEGVEAKVDQTLAWLEAEGSDADRDRRFVFLHTYQVHEPYLPPLEYRDRFNTNPGYDGPVLAAETEARALRTSGGEVEPNGKILFRDKADFGPADVRYLWDLYRAELAFTDAQLGRLFDELKARGEYDDMTIIVTSDHGEEFGEHGLFGHKQLYRETLRVPLIVKLPKGSFEDWRGQVVTERLNQVDVHATLVDHVGGDWPLDAGRSIFADLEDGSFVERTSFAETTEGLYGATVQFGQLHQLRSLRLQDHAFVETQIGGQVTRELEPARLELGLGELAPAPLATAEVPGEKHGDQRLLVVLSAMAARVSQHLASAEETRLELLDGQDTIFTYKVDGETRGELEALGYIDE